MPRATKTYDWVWDGDTVDAAILDDLREYVVSELDLDPDQGAVDVIVVDVLLNLRQIIEAKYLGSLKGDMVAHSLTAAGARSFYGDALKKIRHSATTSSSRSMKKRLDLLEGQLVKLYRQYQGGEFSLRQFSERAKAQLKTAYLGAFILGVRASGIPGLRKAKLVDLQPDDRQWVDSAIKHEFKYFNRLIKDIAKDRSRQSVEKRLGRYVKTVNSIFHAGRVMVVPPNTVIHWILEDRKACPDCKTLWRSSPYVKSRLPTTPKAGLTRCLDNCRCRLRFEDATPAKYKQTFRRNRKSQTMIRRILKDRRKVKKRARR